MKDICFNIYLGNYKSKRELIHFKNLSQEDKNCVYNDFSGKAINNFRVTDNEEKRCISYNTLRPVKFFGKNAFIRNECEAFIVYNKKTKKLYTKNKKAIISAILNNSGYRKDKVTILEIIGFEAFALGGSSGTLMSKVDEFVYSSDLVLKAIFSGRCTNKNNAYKRRYSAMGIKNMSYKKAKLISEGLHHTLAYPAMVCATNIDNLVKFVEKYFIKNEATYTNVISDLIHMSGTIGQKVDFKWSARRMEEEHDKLSKRILEIKFKSLPLEEVEYKIPFINIPGITLLTSNHNLVMESELMHHCIGTSDFYLNQMKAKRAIYFSYSRLNERATAELEWIPNNCFKRLQFNGRGNNSPSREAFEDLDKIIEKINNSEFVNNFKKFKGEPSTQLVDLDVWA